MMPKPILPTRKPAPSAITSGLAAAADLLPRNKLEEVIDNLEARCACSPRAQDPRMVLAGVYEPSGSMFKLHAGAVQAP
jgi:hypothetical protein